MGKIIYSTDMSFGCDPELFLEKGGHIIGSEKVLHDQSLASLEWGTNGSKTTGVLNKNAIVQDGIQIELNPRPNPCRANLGSEIAATFRVLRDHLAKLDNVNASFSSVIEVSQEEMDSLSEKSKLLGCKPSHNMYDQAATVSCDGSTYRTRSAGGHIHIGLSRYSSHLMKHREKLVPLMDVLVGNTSVLIDRDPYAAERRKVYGRAGEYRLPVYGLEYRTLSNYWLKAYPLFSFVMGMTRMAVSVLDSNLDIALLDTVNLDKVKQAINENELELAKENYKPVREFINKYVRQDSMGLAPHTLNAFDHFISKVWESGLEYWFPEDPMTHWCNLEDGHNVGWESFMERLTTKVNLNVA